MKGTPESPECGFSRKIVDILKEYDGIDFGYFNIFSDEEVRAGMKEVYKWPTFP